MKEAVKSIMISLIVVATTSAITYAVGQNGVTVFNGFPLIALGVILIFAINWIAFIPSYIFQTEKFFDLAGSFSFISATVICTILAPVHDAKTLIALALVLIWSIRLGTFLYKRIHKEGKDSRFDELKSNPFTFFTVWTLQGLWVSLTLATALVIITTSVKTPLDSFAFIGLLIWLLGFSIEVIADTQKSKWRSKPENQGQFINVGLWRKSRHPNYFGEIIIWIGMAVIALPVLVGWQYLSLISPLFVFFLLTRISGIPILERRADEKWGGNNEYEEYKKNTPILIPKF